MATLLRSKSHPLSAPANRSCTQNIFSGSEEDRAGCVNESWIVDQKTLNAVVLWRFRALLDRDKRWPIAHRATQAHCSRGRHHVTLTINWRLATLRGTHARGEAENAATVEGCSIKHSCRPCTGAQTGVQLANTQVGRRADGGKLAAAHSTIPASHHAVSDSDGTPNGLALAASPTICPPADLWKKGRRRSLQHSSYTVVWREAESARQLVVCCAPARVLNLLPLCSLHLLLPSRLKANPTVEDAYKTIRNLPRRPSELTLRIGSRPRSSSPLRSALSASTETSPDANMAARASITFTQPGVQPPVYAVTSMSNPPWETLELGVSDDRTESGDLIFTRQFDNVAEGSYQYKIRIGEGYWVVDNSKDTATDDSGNRNNVINVKAEVVDTASMLSLTNVSTKRRQDSVQQSPSEPQSDNSPEHGDDFGKDATSGQKLAHELRAADATPDEIVVSPEPEAKPANSPTSAQADTPSTEESEEPEHAPLFCHETAAPQTESNAEQDTPLFRHEIFQPAIPQEVIAENPIPTIEISKPVQEQDAQGAPLFRHETLREEAPGEAAPTTTSGIDTIEEESARSSTDRESSLAGINTPSEISENRDEDSEAVNDLDDGSLDELDNGPLMSHETGFPKNEAGSLEEHDNGPLLTHETGFPEDDVSDDKIIEDNSDLADYDEDEYGVEFDNSEVPLLPHERISNEPSAGTAQASGMADEEQTFPYETATAREMIYTKTNTGSLPYQLPRSDDEDEDLQDPLLERFPTDREEILERVATLENLLPVDETRESPNSPDTHASSQNCSPVDLRPVTSHFSLKPVREESVLESDSENNSGDDFPAMGVESRKLPEAEAIDGTDSQRPSESTEVSEADSVQKNDGANDSSKDMGKVYNSVATPAKMLNPLTPPLTPKGKARETTEDSMEVDTTPKGSSDTETELLKPQPNASSGPARENWLRAFIRFLTACFGGRKQASGAALVVGLAAAAYYYIYGSKS